MVIKTYFKNHCSSNNTIEKIAKMKQMSDSKFREYLLFDTTQSRTTPKRVRDRREKIFDLLKIIQNGSVSLEAMAKFDALLKVVTDI